MRWISFASGIVIVVASLVAAGLWVWSEWPWFTLPVDNEAPKITDWIQAIGTIAAILLSTVIAIAVPLYVRWLEILRYRKAICLCFLKIYISTQNVHRIIEDTFGRDFKIYIQRIDEDTDNIEEGVRQLNTIPVLMTESPSMFFVTDRVKLFAGDLAHILRSKDEYDLNRPYLTSKLTFTLERVLYQALKDFRRYSPYQIPTPLTFTPDA